MLQKILPSLVIASLVIGLLRRYLTLNKLWIRKHEKAVAESISIVAVFLSLGTSAPFLTKNVLRADYQGTAYELTAVFSNVVVLLVGIGLWVPDKRRPGFWTRLAAALRLERKESRDLVKQFLRPRGASLIVRILHQVAAGDAKLDPRERAYIQQFASSWGIDYPEASAGDHGVGQADYIALKRDMTDYLATQPPIPQVEQLRRVIEALVNIDEVVSEEEDLMLSEVFGMLDQYATGKRGEHHRVVIVPQSPDQEGAIIDVLPSARKIQLAGGTAFLVSSCFSDRYAEMICKRYRALKLLTIVLSEEPSEDAHKTETAAPAGAA